MGRNTIWTKEKCLEESKQFSTKTEWFKNSPSSYAAAKKHGDDLFKLCTKHMAGRGRTADLIEAANIEKDDCINDAKNYEAIEDWEKSSPELFKASKKFGEAFFASCTKHMREDNLSYWTKDKCLEEARKYSTKKVWLQKSLESVISAKKYGEIFLEKCTEHMIDEIENKWNRGNILEEARKYSTEKEWAEKSRSSYIEAKKISENFFEKCLSHMEKDEETKVIRWTKSAVFDEAQRYTSKRVWSLKSESSYRSALIYGDEFFNLCTKHMSD